MTIRSSLFLQEMGIAVQWQRKHLPPASADDVAGEATAVLAEAAPSASASIAAVQDMATAPAQIAAVGGDAGGQTAPAGAVAVTHSHSAPMPAPAATDGARVALTMPQLKRPAILDQPRAAKPLAANLPSMPDDAMPWFDADIPLPSGDEFIQDAAPEWLDFPLDDTPSREALIAAMDWQQLQAAVATCTACDLCRQRRQTVFGRGSETPLWVMAGDTPSGADEAAGVPFTGDEASLLENMVRAIGRTQQVYFTNLVKCRAKDEKGQSRAPNADEIAACRPFLQRQIDLLQPRLILALGKTAALALRAPGATGALRGSVHQALGKPVVATWHPSILLRQPLEKRQAWADLCLAKQADGT